MDYDRDEEVEFSSTQEFARTFPQEKFAVTYVKVDDNAMQHTRVIEFTDNVAVAGSMIEELQSSGVDTVEMFKLEPYPLHKALAVHDKKKKRAARRAGKKEE